MFCKIWEQLVQLNAAVSGRLFLCYFFSFIRLSEDIVSLKWNNLYVFGRIFISVSKDAKIINQNLSRITKVIVENKVEHFRSLRYQ